jgi:hypothetical protein
VSAIKVGDLVMVTHSCCANLGTPFTVGEIDRGDCSWECSLCAKTHPGPVVMKRDAEEGRLCYWPLAWLKKIDPPAQPAQIERDEEVTA